MNKLLVVLMSVFLAGASPRQGAQELTKGVMRFKVGARSYELPLLRLEGASRLTHFGTTWMVNLVYKGAVERNNFAPNARMALRNLTGPGDYDNAAIMNVVVEAEFAHPWGPNNRTDRCKLTITRLQPAGVAGTVSCSGTGARFGDISFDATP